MSSEKKEKKQAEAWHSTIVNPNWYAKTQAFAAGQLLTIFNTKHNAALKLADENLKAGNDL